MDDKNDKITDSLADLSIEPERGAEPDLDLEILKDQPPPKKPKAKTQRARSPLVCSPGRSKRPERRLLHRRCTVTISLVTNGPQGPVNLQKTEGIALDISPSGIGLFVQDKIHRGSTVLITLQYAENCFFECQARVIWSNEYPTLGNIIKTKAPFRWRMGLHFEFRSENEKDSLLELAETL